MTPRGFCPTLFAPMATGDGLLVRVKPPGATLSVAAAQALAGAALRYGSGAIELTSRAGLQVRGLRAATAPPFAAAMVAAGLGHPDPDVERRRTVMAPPLAGDDPGVDPRAALLAAAIAEMLTDDSRLAALPAKFGVVVDGGGVLPIANAPGDIKVRVTASDIPEIVASVQKLALTCIAPPRRLHTPAATTPPQAIGWLRYPGLARGAFGVGLPFGATDAVTLARLADLAARHGDGTLRVTPWRVLAIPGVTAPETLCTAVAALGLIADPADARAAIFACPGAPACASASVPARSDAAWLATLGLADIVHVSGCAKGCAHSGAADVTLVGDGGRYGIVGHGRAGDALQHAGLTIAQAAALLAPA